MEHYIEGPDEAGFYSLPELKTPHGKPFRLKNYELVNLVSLELEFGPPPENEPNMYIICSSFIDNDQEKLRERFADIIEDLILQDSTLYPGPAGPEVIDWLNMIEIVNQYLSSNKLSRPPANNEYWESFEDENESSVSAIITESDEVKKLVAHFSDVLNTLTNYEIEALHAALHLSESLVLSILLVKNHCSAQEFAHVYSSSISHLLPQDLARAEEVELKDIKGGFDDIIHHARNISQFLEEFRKYDSAAKLEKILNEPENEVKEYKSSLRTPIEKDATKKQLYNEVLKSICGLCNHKGGDLYIGVNDDGKILGIEIDKFKSRDEFERTLATIIENRISTDVEIDPTDLSEFEYTEVGEKTVCQVKCKSVKNSGVLPNIVFVEEYYNDGNKIAYKRGKSKNTALDENQIIAHTKEVKKLKSR